MYEQEIRQLLNDLAWVDDVSYYHSLRVGYLMSLFTETPSGKLFLKQAWVTRNECVVAALLHDIAKARWPREVLFSSERLRNMDRELLLKLWKHIIEHPLISEEVVLGFYRQTGNRFWERIAKGVVAHHENYSGDGFPYKLRGAEIPLLARGLRLFDNYASHLEVRRHRKKQLDPKVAINEMRTALGVLYDPYWGEEILNFLDTVPSPPGNLDDWLNEELKNFRL
jgi:HD-GYP domain-containing protein (c-di-GMP phosphodiesterase class II)